jgi:hypothetical protein
MAWFYNPILCQNFEIGLVAASCRLYGPSATVVHKSAFFLRNLRISKIALRAERQKPHFSMSAVSLKFRLFFGREKRQFGLF